MWALSATLADNCVMLSNDSQHVCTPVRTHCHINFSLPGSGCSSLSLSSDCWHFLWRSTTSFPSRLQTVLSCYSCVSLCHTGKQKVFGGAERQFTLNPSMMSLLKMLMYMTYIAHILGCMWHWIATFQEDTISWVSYFGIADVRYPTDWQFAKILAGERGRGG